MLKTMNSLNVVKGKPETSTKFYNWFLRSRNLINITLCYESKL